MTGSVCRYKSSFEDYIESARTPYTTPIGIMAFENSSMTPTTLPSLCLAIRTRRRFYFSDIRRVWYET